jgi:proteasome assembly chaperone (PAC2) family protein
LSAASTSLKNRNLTVQCSLKAYPGIGFVANISALHLIKELKAKKFAEIFSSSFQDFAILTESGKPRVPINELYYVKREEGKRDLIIWYGNTQALTTQGQYELTGNNFRYIDTMNFGLGTVSYFLGGYKRR